MKVRWRSHKGVTLLELLVVIGILAAIAVFGTPNFLGWRHKSQLRGAVSNLKGDMEQAKVRAARENSNVAVEFYADRYVLFIDNGSGAGAVRNNGAQEADEPTILIRRLPKGIRLDLGHSGFTFSNNTATFSPRGTAKTGTAVIVNSRQERMRLRVENYTGKMSIAKL